MEYWGLPCDGPAYHPGGGGGRNTPSHFMPQKPDGPFARMQTLPTCNQILHIAIEALFTCCFISESTNQILNTCSSIQTERKCLVRCPERYRLSSTERHQNSQISYVAYSLFSCDVIIFQN